MSLALNGKPALIISECQRGVIEPAMAGFAGLAAEAEARDIVPRIADLARAFRAAGAPVVHAPIAHRPDFADVPPTSLIAALARKHRRMTEGSAEVDFVAALVPEAQDLVVWRSSGMVAFNGTALDAILRRLGVATVVLSGVSTNLAIAGCALTAADLGYQVVIAEDCIAGSDPRSHAVIVEAQLRMIARIATAADVIAALAAA